MYHDRRWPLPESDSRSSVGFDGRKIDLDLTQCCLGGYLGFAPDALYLMDTSNGSLRYSPRDLIAFLEGTRRR